MPKLGAYSKVPGQGQNVQNVVKRSQGAARRIQGATEPRSPTTLTRRAAGLGVASNRPEHCRDGVRTHVQRVGRSCQEHRRQPRRVRAQIPEDSPGTVQNPDDPSPMGEARSHATAVVRSSVRRR